MGMQNNANHHWNATRIIMMTTLLLFLVLVPLPLLPVSQSSAIFFMADRSVIHPHNNIASAVAASSITTTNMDDQTGASSQQISSLLAVRTITESLGYRELVGIPLIFSHQGNVSIKETPAKINIPNDVQNYTITAPDMLFRNFDNVTFDHWQDDTNSTDRTKTIAISDNNGRGISEDLTAVYRWYTAACDSCRAFLREGFVEPLVIRIVDSEGNLLTGAKVTVAPKTVASQSSSGFSPIATFSSLKNATTYVVSVPATFVGNNFVSMSNNGSSSSNDGSNNRSIYHFDHWQGIDGYYHNDRNTNHILATIYSSNHFFSNYEITLTAVYEKE
ncbi:hypothetical protein NTE_03360 [Candidatus Nitrososphaera evergladensis SR1]|uniref:Uncharacterized protein n=1 Tax=Candidatus Nitrososphaera evergladensis SR1 TaxID=1459636 RepID=A0A075MW69_9ARCH|nr:hypothetical protein [Candidatus Nitrososphaera evergladensis]AIF85388.1 hypothetical protein NTE_03360 [Candidatus Nitrososphaera evergladensis SR1]